jgi:hypothetical protein
MLNPVRYGRSIIKYCYQRFSLHRFAYISFPELVHAKPPLFLPSFPPDARSSLCIASKEVWTTSKVLAYHFFVYNLDIASSKQAICGRSRNIIEKIFAIFSCSFTFLSSPGIIAPEKAIFHSFLDVFSTMLLKLVKVVKRILTYHK